jgi:hypothetical protein
MQNCNFAWCFMDMCVELGHVTLKEEHRLSVFDNRVLRKTELRGRR